MLLILFQIFFFLICRLLGPYAVESADFLKSLLNHARLLFALYNVLSKTNRVS